MSERAIPYRQEWCPEQQSDKRKILSQAPEFMGGGVEADQDDDNRAGMVLCKGIQVRTIEGLIWGQLFNLVPRLCAGCTFGMVIERGSRKKRWAATRPLGEGGPALAAALADVHSLYLYSDKPIPKPCGEVHNFHTDGTVIVRKSGTIKVRNIFKIMLDGGCHGHEGTNYVTRPWVSDEDDIRTIKRTSVNNQTNNHKLRLVIPWPGVSVIIQYQVSPRNCISRPWASDIVKWKLVTKVSKGQEVAKGRNNSRPGVGVNSWCCSRQYWV